MANMFGTIEEQYRTGKLDESLDFVFRMAASDGIILLDGADRPCVEAKCGKYEVGDLLLPVDLQVWSSLAKAHAAGMSIYPDWFTLGRDGYLVYTQDDFLKAFVKYWKLSKHHGSFLMNGEKVTRPFVKNAVRRSLAIVRADAGKWLYGTMASLDAMLVDDEPEKSKTRLSIQTLTDEMSKMDLCTKLNEITASYEVYGITSSGRAMSYDDLIAHLHDSLSDRYTNVSSDTLTMYTGYIARENKFNPVIDLLSATEWDGVDRFPQLFSVLGVQADPLSMTLIIKWLYQSIALLFNDPTDPFGADGVLVLAGEQGVGKTSFFRHLALRDAWFAEGCSIDDRDKDTTRRIVTRWISELGEVESTLKSDVCKLKAFVTSSVDRYRLPYGRSDIEMVRHTSLSASCNSSRYLIDVTGNRRWWSIPIRKKIQREEMLALDSLQLWAQVYSKIEPLTYKEKASIFRLTAEEQELLAQRNGDFEKPSKGQEEVEDILARASEEALTYKRMTVSEFKQQWPILRPYTVMQIGTALKCCGIETTRTKKGRLLELPTPNASDSPWRD